MSEVYGENIQISIFGQSHAPAIGVTIEGLPAGEAVDLDELKAFLARRAPGNNAWSTPRKEADEPEIQCGLANGKTCGAPLTAIIRNQNVRPGDYANLRTVPRPGHADYTAYVKYDGSADMSGGGHFSGRLTAPLCIAGGICKQILKREGIEIKARIQAIGGIEDPGDLLTQEVQADFPVINAEAGQKMQECIAKALSEGDSVGGIIECVVTGLPVGLGGPLFDGMEGRISQAVFGIPAVKGIEFGVGFAAAKLRGSENNDAFCMKDGKVQTETNRCGGILGGITNGMPLVFRAAFKPTPSIAKAQKSVDLTTGEETTLEIKGRHDPCIVPRAVPCVEAAAAIAVYDALLGRRKELNR
ncbi:MAG: chorismate synthase [Lachnospiraceae bacterium]|nr:chorismate synthase [Lachnospiraceae bacterium]